MSDTLPEGWAVTTLGDLANYVTSGSRDWSKYYANEGALFIRTQDINQNKLAPLAHIARVALPNHVEGKRTLTQQGDLLITITGANVGKCAYIDQSLPEAYVSQSIALVKLVDGLNGRFLHRQLMSPSSGDERTLLQRSAYGVGRPVLNLDNVKEIPLCIAPLSEQHRVVAKVSDLLSHLNSLRDRLYRVVEILKHFRQAVLAAACSGKLTEGWRAKDDGPQRDRELITCDGWTDDPLPSGWAVRTVGDVGSVLGGKRLPKGAHYATEVTSHAYIRVTDFHNMSIDTGDIKYIDETTHRAVKRYTISDTDAYISIAGTIGKVGLVPPQLSGANLTENAAKITKLQNVSKEYLVLALNSPAAQNQIQDAITSSGQPKLALFRIEKLLFPLPPLQEQCEIVRRVKMLLKTADGLHTRVNTAFLFEAKLTQSILAKAFRGELVPTEAELARREGRDYEPASVLFERIKKQREQEASKDSKPKRNRKASLATVEA